MTAEVGFAAYDGTPLNLLRRQFGLAASYKFHDQTVGIGACFERVVALYPLTCIRAKFTYTYAVAMTLARGYCLNLGQQWGHGLNIELRVRREQGIRAAAVTVTPVIVFGHVLALHTKKRKRIFLQKAMAECFRSVKPNSWIVRQTRSPTIHSKRH